MNDKMICLRNRIRGLDMEGMIVSNPINIKYLTRNRSRRCTINYKKRKHLYN